MNGGLTIKFIAYLAQDAGRPTAQHNLSRVDWIKESGKEGRSLKEIFAHPKHYKNPQADLNYDLQKKYIKIKVQK